MDLYARGLQRRALLALALTAAAGGCMPPSWGANAMLHPWRRKTGRTPAEKFEDLKLAGEGVELRGWLFRTPLARRGTVVYLHGVSDNRASGLGIAQHLTGRGFDVLAYDSRAHGESGGEACTYGFHEKRDLSRVLDRLPSGSGPIVLLGNSMGAGVALQAAAVEPRVAAVIAVATISDLRTAARERAPFFASRGNIDKALAIAEQEGRFRVDEVSPVAAAARIRCPVFLIHGDSDDETPPDHSRRVFQALRAPKQLRLTPGAGHGNALDAEAWRRVDAWMDSLFPGR